MSDAQLHPYVNVSLYDHPKKTSAPQKKATLKRQEEICPLCQRCMILRRLVFLEEDPVTVKDDHTFIKF